MTSRVRFSEQFVLRANAELIQQHGRPTRLPRELLGIVTYRPRTLQEIKSAFASAYAKMQRT